MSSILGLSFAFAASIFKSGSELSSKYFINDQLDEYVAGFGYRAFALPVLSILVLYFGVPEIKSNFWISLAAVVPLNVLATIMYMKALKYSDISIVSPIKAISPMALLVTSPIMIGEYASPVGMIGVVFVTFGVYMLKITSSSEGTLLTPFKRLLDERGAQYAFGVMLIYSITSNVDKIGVEASSPIFWTFAVHLSIGLVLFGLMLYKVDNGISQVQSNWKKLLPMGTLSGLGVAAQMTALSYTLVVYVIAIKRTALLWNIIGGTIFMGEKGFRERVAGGLLIVIGVVVISVSL